MILCDADEGFTTGRRTKGHAENAKRVSGEFYRYSWIRGMTDYIAFWVKKDGRGYFPNRMAFLMRIIIFQTKEKTASFAFMNVAAIFWPLSILFKNKRINNFYRVSFFLQIGLSVIICGIMLYGWYFTEKGTITDLMGSWLSTAPPIFVLLNFLEIHYEPFSLLHNCADQCTSCDVHSLFSDEMDCDRSGVLSRNAPYPKRRSQFYPRQQRSVCQRR
jgi:hypothetical protein